MRRARREKPRSAGPDFSPLSRIMFDTRRRSLHPRESMAGKPHAPDARCRRPPDCRRIPPRRGPSRRRLSDCGVQRFLGRTVRLIGHPHRHARRARLQRDGRDCGRRPEVRRPAGSRRHGRELWGHAGIGTAGTAESVAGKATVTFVAGAESGMAVITASSGSQASVRIPVGAAAATRLNMSAAPTAVPFNGGTSTISATVLDAGGSRSRASRSRSPRHRARSHRLRSNPIRTASRRWS